MKKKILIAIIVVLIGVAAYFAYDKFFIFHLPEENEVSSAVIEVIDPMKDKQKIKINEDEAKSIYHEMKKKIISENGQRVQTGPSEKIVLYNNDRELLSLYVRRDLEQNFVALPDSDYRVSKSFIDMLDKLELKYKRQ